MLTQSSKDLLFSFDTWKTQTKKIKEECGVAEMNEPGVTKDSREGLHDTLNATDSIKDWRTFWSEVLNEPEENPDLNRAKQETVGDFADTICCALEKMSGKEVFECFLEAVQDQHSYTKKEYDKACELLKQIT